MKITKNLDVSQKEIFDFLCENLKKEMKISSKLKEGMVFEKEILSKFNKKIGTKVKILSFLENEGYTLQFISPFGENIVRYSLEKISENKTKVICEEKYKADSFFKNLNNMLMEIIFYINIKRKKNKIFDQIEQHIIKERENNG